MNHLISINSGEVWGSQLPSRNQEQNTNYITCSSTFAWKDLPLKYITSLSTLFSCCDVSQPNHSIVNSSIIVFSFFGRIHHCYVLRHCIYFVNQIFETKQFWKDRVFGHLKFSSAIFYHSKFVGRLKKIFSWTIITNIWAVRNPQIILFRKWN